MVPAPPGRLAKCAGGNSSLRVARPISSALIFSSEARVTPSADSMARTRRIKSDTAAARWAWSVMELLLRAGLVVALQRHLAAEEADGDLRIARHPARRGAGHPERLHALRFGGLAQDGVDFCLGHAVLDLGEIFLRHL